MSDAGQVGARLRDARVARGLSLEDVAHTTKVPRSSLVLIESDAFQQLPAPVFVRGFIRAYAKTVGLDPNPLVRLYEARVTSADPLGPDGPARGQPREASRGLTPQDLYPAPQRSRRGESLGNDAAEAAQQTGHQSRRPAPATERKLVPLEPLSERREGSFRGGYTLLAVVVVGLLIAAWLMVGGKRPASDASARGPTGVGATGPGTPALHDQINGIPSLEEGQAPRLR